MGGTSTWPRSRPCPRRTSSRCVRGRRPSTGSRDAMAKRVHQVCRVLVEQYDGRAENVWADASSGERGARGRAVAARLRPGEGGHLHGAAGQAARRDPAGLAGGGGAFGEDGVYRSVADIVDEESLQRVRETKRQSRPSATRSPPSRRDDEVRAAEVKKPARLPGPGRRRAGQLRHRPSRAGLDRPAGGAGRPRGGLEFGSAARTRLPTVRPRADGDHGGRPVHPGRLAGHRGGRGWPCRRRRKGSAETAPSRGRSGRGLPRARRDGSRVGDRRRGRVQRVGNTEQTVTARLLSLPFGQILVVAVGAIVAGIGIAQIVRGVKSKFVQDLRSGVSRAVRVLGTAGYVAKGIALVIRSGSFRLGGAQLQPGARRRHGRGLVHDPQPAVRSRAADRHGRRPRLLRTLLFAWAKNAKH